MATLREYFDTDLKGYYSKRKTWGMTEDSSGKTMEPVIARISQDLEANAKYWSFYIPPTDNVIAYVGTVLSMSETRNCVLGPEGDDVLV